MYVLARIKGSRPADLPARRPLNLSMVLDRSGSMAGDKLEYVRQAAEFLVRRLGADDLLSLVTYDDQVRVEFAPAPPVHKDAISTAIRRITSGNTTNLSGGWMQGCQLVAEHMAAGQVNRVLDQDEVAPHHCVIRRAGSALVLEDPGSSAGTFANGGLVGGPFRLSAGDVVTAGMALLRFE